MNTIHKFELDIEDEQAVGIKGLIKVLSAEEQYDNLVLYAMVDTDNKEVSKVRIAIRGTGHPLGILFTQPNKFLNTIKLRNGMLMLHIFLMEKRIGE